MMVMDGWLEDDDDGVVGGWLAIEVRMVANIDMNR